jgi:hypothetical protein
MAIEADVQAGGTDLSVNPLTLAEMFPVFIGVVDFLLAIPFLQLGEDRAHALCDRLFPIFPLKTTLYLERSWRGVAGNRRFEWLTSLPERLLFVSDPAVTAGWCRMALQTPVFIGQKDMVRKVGVLHFTSAVYLASKSPPSEAAESFARYLIRTAPEGEALVSQYLVDLSPQNLRRFWQSIPAAHRPLYSSIFADRRLVSLPVPAPAPLYRAPPFVGPATRGELAEAYEIAAFTEDRAAMRSLFPLMQGWKFTPPLYSFSAAFGADIAAAQTLELPAELALLHVFGPWRASAVRSVRARSARVMRLLGRGDAVKQRVLVALSALVPLVEFPRDWVVEFALGVVQASAAPRRLAAGLRLLAVALRASEETLTPAVFAGVAPVLRRLLPALPPFELSLVLLAFDASCGADPAFLALVADALAHASAYLPEGTNHALVLRSHPAESARRRRAAGDFDAVAAALLEGPLPSQVARAAGILNAPHFQGGLRAVVIALAKSAPLRAAVAAAAALMRRRRWAELADALQPLLALDPARAEFAPVLPLLVFAAKNGQPEIAEAVAAACERVVVQGVCDPLRAALVSLEHRAVDARPKESRAAIVCEVFRGWLARLPETDGYATATVAAEILRRCEAFAGPQVTLALICDEFVPGAPRFLPAFAMAAKYGARFQDLVDTKDALARAAANARLNCHRAAFTALRRGLAKEAFELAKYEIDCAESDAMIIKWRIAG